MTRSKRIPPIVFAFALTAIGCHGDRANPRPPAPVASDAHVGGLYWGRLAEVPDGMRVQVWLDSDGTRVRGSYAAVPWNGEIEGAVQGRDAVRLTLIERGITRAIGARTREITLRWDARHTALAGTDERGGRVELVRAGFASASLRPGLWLSRWTGLPFGMAVETRLSHDPDGHWRAVYQYQGAGGARDGSFTGETGPDGVLTLAWSEIPEGTAPRAQGHARLSPSEFGLRGTYGIEGATEGIGEWEMEPLGE